MATRAARHAEDITMQELGYAFVMIAIRAILPGGKRRWAESPVIPNGRGAAVKINNRNFLRHRVRDSQSARARIIAGTKTNFSIRRKF